MPKLLNIITHPNEILREKSVVIKKTDILKLEMKKLCEDMTLTMLEKDGVGLAAPQIGKNIRLAVVNTKSGPLHIFNPEIVKFSWTKEWGEEGCLSVPGVFGQVKRSKTIICNYTDKEGAPQSIEVSGLMARVFQHEIDHLDGILFIDKAKKIK
ncbi:MAG: Peptide deformylase [Candidatus Falkowbacteria bacterium GW2011_GWC2_38_22]|uniref:Peptide deformylase n=1 Tax=Candidatus Falkowbacteria bacterium GW2011_GWE1_38_31 TaxID=1618638 RepID=A0A0G0JWH7_9BACT|nr:MAG: Peptide deformylase [Candidatus Falkowbacteria bacterium GW2011_GWF2_38_1205]KKQ62142.1 MAG: Peptide deformylase [Candidatus Falkowbacteria bacterium GW2011_GWC2_38_22]KKQ64292.1 MAG: Peptide deformylase [Candidatus Falkowbacteria bacterium GW2011_GWF1_38_22]KKQ66269.1 MAG: Peptide deformylase [Candidatus Falkowbacteria bacterium GW2011_GWE2_38_254]KKQ70997.1 MAG: Peptide deformylase [Candidatus Falkowbacteria bacterium GW2011_GWE1_38_31]KKQ73506.1 MAG: Peptide deformylase [Candidatus 